MRISPPPWTRSAPSYRDDVILLFGSFYSVAEGLEWLARRTDKGE